jgi:hypothetical protein
MLCEAYIEALLVDEELADQVWEAWDIDLRTSILADHQSKSLSNIIRAPAPSGVGRDLNPFLAPQCAHSMY